MRKLLAVLAILIFSLVGCCTKFNPDSGEVSKSFLNCVEKWKESGTKILCSFSAEQIQAAGNAAQFLKIVFGPNYSAAVARATAIFLNIHAGLCVAEDQLKTALDAFDTAVLVSRPVMVQGKTMAQAPVSVKVPDVSALRKAVVK